MSSEKSTSIPSAVSWPFSAISEISLRAIWTARPASDPSFSWGFPFPSLTLLHPSFHTHVGQEAFHILLLAPHLIKSPSHSPGTSKGTQSELGLNGEVCHHSCWQHHRRIQEHQGMIRTLWGPCAPKIPCFCSGSISRVGCLR